VERDKKHKRIKRPLDEIAKSKVKFEVYGEEMLEKVVSLSGNSGRIYLPPDWVGHQVKIVRID
jgi:putative transposon-encoded protein